MQNALRRKDALPNVETKFAQMEIKVESASDEFLTVSGYGSVFGVTDQGGDVVEPGAFRESIASGAVPKMLWQHDPSQPIGVWDSVAEDARGLFMRGRISKRTVKGAEVCEMIQMGAIDGLSIGYAIKDNGSRLQDGRRFISDVELWETSVVTFPMNRSAGITEAKSADDMTEAEIKRHVEKSLRKIGISAREAKAMASASIKGMDEGPRDVGTPTPEYDQRDVDELKASLTETLRQMEAHT